VRRHGCDLPCCHRGATSSFPIYGPSASVAFIPPKMIRPAVVIFLVLATVLLVAPALIPDRPLAENVPTKGHPGWEGPAQNHGEPVPTSLTNARTAVLPAAVLGGVSERSMRAYRVPSGTTPSPSEKREPRGANRGALHIYA